MKSYKTWALSVLATTCALLTLIMAVNYLIDPLQFYHRSFYNPDFSDQQRYQNPGLAKNYDYNTIIIGSSMSENILPSYVNQKLKVKTLKLSIMGSSAKEQSMIAKLAIDTGKVKNIIWVIDYFGLRGDPDRVRDEYGPFPFYLYDKDPLNDVKYLLNIDTLKQVMHIALVSIGFEQRENPNLDTLNTWSYASQFGRANVLKEWYKYSKGGPFSADEYELDNVTGNLDKNILALIKDHPEINFNLYYPPYSVLQHRYYYDKNPVLFENELTSKRYVFNSVGMSPNVKIFDFQQEKKWTFNLNNYKDLAHHNPEINRQIIDALAKNQYRVTPANMENGLTTLKDQVATLNWKQL